MSLLERLFGINPKPTEPECEHAFRYRESQCPAKDKLFRVVTYYQCTKCGHERGIISNSQGEEDIPIPVARVYTKDEPWVE